MGCCAFISCLIVYIFWLIVGNGDLSYLILWELVVIAILMKEED